MTALLEIDRVTKTWGGVVANREVSLTVPEGRIVGLIGPNGSGKTTLFGSITGAHPIDSGSIRFRGREISTLRAAAIARLGLVRTFQQTRIYGEMTCVQNMLISAPNREEGILDMFRRFPAADRERTDELLEFVGLYEKRLLIAGDLSFGQRKLLEFAMALMNEPSIAAVGRADGGNQSDTHQFAHRSVEARQFRARRDAVRHRTQHARDHVPRRAYLLPGAR